MLPNQFHSNKQTTTTKQNQKKKKQTARKSFYFLLYQVFKVFSLFVELPSFVYLFKLSLFMK